MINKDFLRTSKYLSLLTQIGLLMVINILIFLGLGVWLDKIFKTNGIFLIVLLLIGIISGFYSVYKVINESLAD